MIDIGIKLTSQDGFAPQAGPIWAGLIVGHTFGVCIVHADAQVK
jgi:hypothetical protein